MPGFRICDGAGFSPEAPKWVATMFLVECLVKEMVPRAENVPSATPLPLLWRWHGVVTAAFHVCWALGRGRLGSNRCLPRGPPSRPGPGALTPNRWVSWTRGAGASPGAASYFPAAPSSRAPRNLPSGAEFRTCRQFPLSVGAPARFLFWYRSPRCLGGAFFIIIIFYNYVIRIAVIVRNYWNILNKFVIL